MDKPEQLKIAEDCQDEIPTFTLSSDNLEKLEALAYAWGIPVEYALNVAVSDQYDSKVGAMRDATGD